MAKSIKNRRKVKSKPSVTKRGKKSRSVSTTARARSKAAKKGWITRRAHTRKAMSKADFPPDIQRLIDDRVKKEVARELAKTERKVSKTRQELERNVKATLMVESFDREIERRIDSGEFIESDETRILGRLFLVNELNPVDFDDEIMRLADDFDDWSVHDIYELWYYGEVA
jgi:hypothetical protein